MAAPEKEPEKEEEIKRVPEEPPPDLFRRTLSQDIDTAGYYELVAWLKQLGLDPSGGVPDLRKKLYEHYKLPSPIPGQTASEQTITIDSANATEYFTLVQNDEKYIRISGGVQVTLTDTVKDVTHTINADLILLNQTNNTMTASGNVIYNLIKSNSKETFRGESLTFNLDDWRGIFFNGVSQRNRNVSGASMDFYFSGDAIKRSSQDVIVLQSGIITSSEPEDPYYHIKAKKIWIFAPGEWGLQDAALYIGRVPVFFFPFFFQPGDEMFFNPVLGGLPNVTDDRGAFLQTTTYFFGEKKKEASPLSFLQLTEGDKDTVPKVIRGLYLVRGNKPAKEAPTVVPVQSASATGSKTPQDSTKDWVFKLLADLYTNLGIYAGVDASLTNVLGFRRLATNAGLGLTRNIYKEGGFATPYNTSASNFSSLGVFSHELWNKSYFLGLQLPFRFGLKLDASIDPFNFLFEYYSDPFHRRDFLENRSENFSMFSVIGFGPKKNTVNLTETTSLQWKGSGSLNPQVTALNPWLRSLSVTPLETYLDFSLAQKNNNILDGSKESEVDPSRKFFYPVKLTSPKLGLNLTGDFFSWNSQPSTSTPQKPQQEGVLLKAPWVEPERPADREEIPQGEVEKSQSVPSGPSPKAPGLLSPLSASLASPQSRISLSYNLAPVFTLESLFDSTRFTQANLKRSKPEEIDFSIENSLFRLENRGGLTFSLSLIDALLSVDSSVSFVQNYQKNYFISDKAFVDEVVTASNTQSQIDLQKANLLSGRQTRLNDSDEDFARSQVLQTVKLGVQPLNFWEPFKGSNLSYALNLRLYENSYSYISSLSKKVRQDFFPDWTPTTVSLHEASATLNFNPFSPSGLLSLSGTAKSTLEPRVVVQSVSGKVSSQIGFVKNTLVLSAQTLKNDWTPDPINFTTEFSPFQDLRLTNALVYDIKATKPQSDTVTLTWSALVARFTALQTRPYYFDPIAKAWIAKSTEDQFLPFDTSLNWRWNVIKQTFWKDRIELSGNVNTSLFMNLQQFTNQPDFTLTLGLTLKVMDFLDLTIDQTSSNKSFYRYFPPLMEALGIGQPAINPLEDLLKSFNFFNDDDRRASNFKIKSLNLNLVHYMKDWTLNFTYSGSPQRIQTGTRSQFQWSTSFSVLLKWKPIPEIKAKTDVDKDGNMTLKTDQ